MLHHYNCCVPGCTNSFRNAPNLKFYRIPKDLELRKKYQVLLRNKTLKLEKESTRVCSVHFEEGEKLNRQHLPSIFPWSKEKVHRRELKRIYPENSEVSENYREKRRPSQSDNEMNREIQCCSDEVSSECSTVYPIQDKNCQTLTTGEDLGKLQQEVLELRKSTRD